MIAIQKETVLENREYSKEDILSINFKVENEELLAFELVTKEDIWFEESEEFIDHFRLDYNKKENKLTVYVAWLDDYDVSDEVTSLFNAYDLLAHCLEADRLEELEDHTEWYENFYKDSESN